MLTLLTRVAAPFLPMIAEEVHGGLTGGESVHLCDWPDPDAESLPDDDTLVQRMDRLRDAVSTALRLREDSGLRVRLPLTELTVAGVGAESLKPLAGLLADEVNVKSVLLTDNLEAHGKLVLRPDGRVLGPRLGREVQAVFAAAKTGDWQQGSDGSVTAAGHRLEPGTFELAVEATAGEADDADGSAGAASNSVAAALASGDAVVVLNTDVTPELRAEGWARDAVRLIQDFRRTAGLQVTDRIRLRLLTQTPELVNALEHWGSYVAEQTLAVELESAVAADGGRAGSHRGASDGFSVHEGHVEGMAFTCCLKRV